jgi:mono/diheme cytochrome c family protein
VKAFLTGVIIGIILVGIGAGYYFVSGKAPAAVEDKPMPMEKFFANKALDAHIQKEMPKSIPLADENAYLAGAQVYQDSCAICHGLPNVDQTPMAKGMFPKPPALSKARA